MMAVPKLHQATLSMTDSAFFCELTHEGVLAVTGPDAAKFLQGQLTCNLNYLSTTQSSLGARCTAKGRMQSSFRLVSEADGFLLAMAGELLAKQMADLQKYAVFSKVSLSDASQAWTRFGLVGGEPVLAKLAIELPEQADSVARGSDCLAIRLRDGRVELWCHTSQATSLRAQLIEHLSEGVLEAWQLAQVRAGIGQVFGETWELFIPQMINLPTLGGVSFKKGCYTGQEIVARMQYLGKLKRHLHRLQAEGPFQALPAPGVELFSPVHGSSVGEVVLAARTSTGMELLAVVQDDAVADTRIYLGSPDGQPLTLLALPYTPDNALEIAR